MSRSRTRLIFARCAYSLGGRSWRDFLTDGTVYFVQLARGTPGFSGAELANVVNQAALRASIEHKDKVDLSTLEWAKDKIMMGPERKGARITDKDLKVSNWSAEHPWS